MTCTTLGGGLRQICKMMSGGWPHQQSRLNDAQRYGRIVRQQREALAGQQGNRKAYATGHPTHSQVVVMVAS